MQRVRLSSEGDPKRRVVVEEEATRNLIASRGSVFYVYRDEMRPRCHLNIDLWLLRSRYHLPPAIARPLLVTRIHRRITRLRFHRFSSNNPAN